MPILHKSYVIQELLNRTLRRHTLTKWPTDVLRTLTYLNVFGDR